ncbi:MAG: hypothetical protein ABW210_03115 [Achromobacter sp.]|jgi:hypothetical protein
MPESTIPSPDALPQRAGPAPKVYPGPPQHQLEQHPEQAQWQALRTLVEQWESADKAPTLRGTPGTLGLFLPKARAGVGEYGFLIGREFAHHHPDDGGLHMTLPSAWCKAVIARGWGEPHVWAGRPTVSANTVLVYAPRNAQEIDVVRRLIEVSEGFADGTFVD